MADVMECSNCSAPIGRLEDAHVWLDRPICEACDARIRVKQRRRAGLVPVWLAAATAVAAAVAALALLLGGFAAYRAYAAPPAAEVSRYDWKNGDPPVRMIRKEEGFCYLTALSGGFAGGGEVANVYVRRRRLLVPRRPDGHRLPAALRRQREAAGRKIRAGGRGAVRRRGAGGGCRVPSGLNPQATRSPAAPRAAAKRGGLAGVTAPPFPPPGSAAAR